MAAKIRIQLDTDGIRQLLCSDAIATECERAASSIASAAGEGFEVTPRRSLGYGGGRVGCGVAAATYEARLAEAEDKALTKAVGRCSM